MRALPFEYAVRNLGRTPVRTGLGVAGSALVVLLVLAALAFVNGMSRSLRFTGSADNVIVLGAGSEESIERSEIDAQVGSILAASVPGLRSRLGVPYVSPQIHLALGVRSSPEQARARLAVIRGVDSRAFLVHRQVRLVEGRAPEAGRDEVMVGRLVASKIGARDLPVGSTLWIDERPWTVSGRFEAPHTVMDAEIWCPLTDLQILARRDSLSCVVVGLGAAEMADVQAFAAQRLDLEITAMAETEYYRSLQDFFGPIRAMVVITAALVALGGVLGGLNTTYAAFASRVRELATLQVLGYRRLAILLTLIQESLLTAAVGAILAVAAGMLLLDGLAVRFSMGAFGLVVDHRVVTISLLAGLGLGVFGAVPPALRSLRPSIAEALRSA